DASQALAGGKIGPPKFEIDAKAGQVVRRDTAGKILWSARLDGELGGGSEPQLLYDAKRVYVRHRGGVTALSAQTGIVLWHVEGRQDRLLLHGDHLLTTRDTGRDRWAISRAVTTGAELFKFRLPEKIVAGLPLGQDRVLLSEWDVVRLS